MLDDASGTDAKRLKSVNYDLKENCRIVDQGQKEETKFAMSIIKMFLSIKHSLNSNFDDSKDLFLCISKYFPELSGKTSGRCPWATSVPWYKGRN